jgi:hypothetical protein
VSKCYNVYGISDSVSCVSLLLLAINLRIKLEDVVVFGAKETPNAFIKVLSGSILDRIFAVIVDGINVVETGCFISAVKIWFAVQFVFNLAFAKENASFLTFLQKAVVGHKDQNKNDTKVINLLVEIRAM